MRHNAASSGVVLTSMTGEYEFSNSWFEDNRRIWDDLIQRLLPSKILEVGSFEGRSTCYLIDTLSPHGTLSVHCIDTWKGGGLSISLEGRWRVI